MFSLGNRGYTVSSNGHERLHTELRMLYKGSVPLIEKVDSYCSRQVRAKLAKI
jgi:hypothetical protein